MKKLIIVTALIVGLFFNSNAQTNNSTYFEKGSNWEQIVEKAKQQNKLIFVDTYTTWCAPCKMMDKEIFPQESVGAFLNENFINVKVQIDATKNDNEEVKSWYKQAAIFEKEYQINQFPTFLIFNANGKLANKVIGGNSLANEFVDRVKEAIKPSNQFYTLKSKYEAGNSSATLVSNMLNAAVNVFENDFIKQQGNIYLRKQKNLLSEENIKIIGMVTSESTHPGFKVLMENPSEVTAVLGAAKRKELIINAALNEVVVPYLRNGGKMIKLGGGMINYTGVLISDANWELLKEKLNVSYSAFADELIMAAKPMYFDWKRDLPNYVDAVNTYVINYGNEIPNMNLIVYSSNILSKSNSTTELRSATSWVNLALRGDDKQNPYFMYQMAALNYKIGDKPSAIKVLENAIEIAESKNDANSGGYKSLLEKMKAGEKIW